LGIAYLFNGYVAHLTSRIINDARFVAAIVAAWAFLGRERGKIGTRSGGALPEQVDRFWPRLLHLIGVWLTFFTFLLRPT
jgi:hypothetical protein